METFKEKFCEAEGCPESEFNRKVFWRCLHRHALPLAPFILLWNRSYFAADRTLVARVETAKTMSQVWTEVREFFSDPAHTGWWRRRANVRISAHRLIVLAKQHLPSSGRPARVTGDE